MPADYELLRFASAVLGAVMIGGAFQPDHGGRRDGKSGFESRTELRIYRHNYS